MVESITISNGSHSVLLNRTDSDYLIDDNGINWGEVSSRFSTLSNLDGYGAELNAIETTDPREIHIIGWVVGTEAQMAAKKAYLTQVLYPQKDLTITVPKKRDPNFSYFIRVYVSKAVSFGDTVQTNNEKMCRFEVTFSAIYPFFEHTRQYTITSSGNILNLGSLPVGARISLALNSAVSNPAIYIGQSSGFGVLGSFSQNDVIFMNTQKSHKIITLNGIKNYSILNTNIGWAYIPVSYSDTDEIPISVSSGVTATLEFNEAYTTVEDL